MVGLCEVQANPLQAACKTRGPQEMSLKLSELEIWKTWVGLGLLKMDIDSKMEV